jgi:hypothetical protein
MEYIILDGHSIDELTKKVNDYLQRGWMPQGGVFVYPAMRWTFYQAMVKEKL